MLTEFAISKLNGSLHVYRTSFPDVGNVLGALVPKSYKIEKIPLEILVLSFWEVFLSVVTVSCAEPPLILLLNVKGKRGNVHPKTGHEVPGGCRSIALLFP